MLIKIWIVLSCHSTKSQSWRLYNYRFLCSQSLTTHYQLYNVLHQSRSSLVALATQHIYLAVIGFSSRSKCLLFMPLNRWPFLFKAEDFMFIFFIVFKYARMLFALNRMRMQRRRRRRNCAWYGGVWVRFDKFKIGVNQPCVYTQHSIEPSSTVKVQT